MRNNLTLSYDFNIVALSAGITFIAMYLTTILSDNHRVGMRFKPRVLKPEVLFIVQSFCFGGGIWSMHWIGLTACGLVQSDNTLFNIRYNILLIFVSLILTLLFSYLGIKLTCFDKIFLDKCAASKAQSTSNMKSLFDTLLYNLVRIFAGGVMVACGICGLHFIALLAIVTDNGGLEIEWNPGMVALTVIVAVLGCCAIIWMMFRLLVFFPDNELAKLGCSFAGTFAICCMHYLGMKTAQFTLISPESARDYVGHSVDSKTLLYSILFCWWIIMWISATVVQGESRNLYFVLQSSVLKTDTIIDELRKHPLIGKEQFIVEYDGIRSALPIRSNQPWLGSTLFRHLKRNSRIEGENECGVGSSKRHMMSYNFEINKSEETSISKRRKVNSNSSSRRYYAAQAETKSEDSTKLSNKIAPMNDNECVQSHLEARSDYISV